MNFVSAWELIPFLTCKIFWFPKNKVMPGSSNQVAREDLKRINSSIAGFGLACTTKLHSGDFIGFYCGEEREGSCTKEEACYAMSITANTSFIAHPSKYASDILGYVNEARSDALPNVQVLPYYLLGALHTKHPMACAMALYARETIEAGSELLIDYGKKYPRGSRRKPQELVNKHLLTTDRVKDPRTVIPFLPLECFVSLRESEKLSTVHTARDLKKVASLVVDTLPVNKQKRPRGRPPKSVQPPAKYPRPPGRAPNNKKGEKMKWSVSLGRYL